MNIICAQNENRGTQFVFSDLGTYKPNEWNVYTDIKEKLVNLGIPTDEVQFIQCATTERARKRLFEDMNNGKVRVLFGSTTMLGTGGERPAEGCSGASFGDSLGAT